jgi:hypothetical protein
MLMGLGQGYWENQEEVWVNTTRIAKISANPKNSSNHNTSQENDKCENILNLHRGAVIYQCKTLQEDVKE